MPRNNPPAATSMMEPTAAQPCSAEETAQKEFLTRLVASQRYDGAFCIQDTRALLSGETMRALFGDQFLMLLQKIETRALPLLVGHGTMATLTIAIMVVLDLHFQQCKDVWELMYDKAKQYLDRHYRQEYPRLEREARTILQSFIKPMPQGHGLVQNTHFGGKPRHTSPKPTPTVPSFSAPSESSTTRKRPLPGWMPPSPQPSQPAVRKAEGGHPQQSSTSGEITPGRRKSLEIAPFTDEA
jgi:hypothetical protein